MVDTVKKWERMSILALDDIKILDLTRQGPGPFCTMILGDQGAEVVKIEAPSTAGARQAGLFQSPEGEAGRKEAMYDALNRNKKSVAIDLRSEEGRAYLLPVSREDGRYC